jgi:hypothetical protein
MKKIKEDDNEEGTDLDEDVYTKEGREELVEDDEMDDSEEAFMEGYENMNLACCDHCGANFTDEDNIIEEEDEEGEILRFCCKTCQTNYHKKYD